MNFKIQRVEPQRAEEIRNLFATVARTSLEDSRLSLESILENVNDNIDAWIASPRDSLMLGAFDAGSLVGAIQIKEYWN